MGSEAYLHVKIPLNQYFYDIRHCGIEMTTDFEVSESEAVLRVKSTFMKYEQAGIGITPLANKIHLFDKETSENLM